MKALHQAIFKVRKRVGSLAKDDRNPHFKFNYVPIDDFYEKVAGVAFEEGLMWRLFESAPVTSAGGMFVIQYSVDLFYEEETHPWDKITIMHPPQGAQTAGAARSYAEKIFMRHLFKIVTGEPDSDGTAQPGDQDPVVIDSDPVVVEGEHIGEPKDAPAGQIKPEDIKAVVSRVDDKKSPVFDTVPEEDQKELVLNIFKKFLPLHKTEKSLTEWWAKNVDFFDLIQETDKSLYDEIKAMFTKRKKEV